MKLSELLQEQNIAEQKKAIKEWLLKNVEIKPGQIKIRPNLIVDTISSKASAHDAVIFGPTHKPGYENVVITDVPFKFGNMENHGGLVVQSHPGITSWDFLPDECITLSIGMNKLSKIPAQASKMKCQTFTAYYNDITSLENIPQNCGVIDLTNNPITSLVDVHEHLKTMKRNRFGIPCTLRLNFGNVTSGGIGLILVEGLERIDTSHVNKNVTNDPFVIISKYLGKPQDLFECQTELLEQGFEEFAKL